MVLALIALALLAGVLCLLIYLARLVAELAELVRFLLYGQSTERTIPMSVHPKVQSAGIAGAVSVLLVFIAAQLGVEVSAEVAAALTTVLAFAAGYLKSA